MQNNSNWLNGPSSASTEPSSTSPRENPSQALCGVRRLDTIQETGPSWGQSSFTSSTAIWVKLAAIPPVLDEFEQQKKVVLLHEQLYEGITGVATLEGKTMP